MMQRASDFLLDFHKAFEGYSTTPYDDGTGVLTIGIGHANQDTAQFDSNDVWDDDKIIEVWHDDLERSEELSAGWLQKEVPQPYFDACVDIVFNTGKWPKSFVRKIHIDDYAGAAKEILRWVYAGNRIMLGLVKRRFAMYVHVLGGDWREVADCPLSSKNYDEFNALINKWGYALERGDNGYLKLVEV